MMVNPIRNEEIVELGKNWSYLQTDNTFNRVFHYDIIEFNKRKRGGFMEIQQETYQSFPGNASFLTTIFPQDNENYYLGFFNLDPFFSPRKVYSLKSNGHIRATLWYLPRLFLNKEKMILAAGIANVATDPSFRGRGLASRLMERALKEAKNQDIEFLVLVTEIPTYYEKWGFQEIGKYQVVIKSSSSPSHISFKPESFENVLDIYEDFYQRYQKITPFRNIAYMRGMEEWNQWASMFTFGGGRAGWFRVTDALGNSVVSYGLDKGDHFEAFEILWEENIDVNGLKLLLHKWAGHLKKDIYVDLPWSVINHLNLKAEKDPINTVMVKPLGDSIDLKRIYLPVPDYF